MSIGELLNLYKDNELDIHPAFQRVFRWDVKQKSRLIESVLLGIPLPGIYVATNEDGVWEVIDGVQRLSTIFEFMGELNGPAPEGSLAKLELKPPLQLEGTKHLPELAGVKFEGMDHALRLEFKRSRLDVKVLAREPQGTPTGKFDLFERLNTYGEPLSPQELRNCVLVSLNLSMFNWLKELASDAAFRSSTLLSETQMLEKYDMDLALRFIVLRNADLSSIGDVHEFLRDEMEKIATSPTFNKQGEDRLFREVFGYLDSNLGGDAFRSWKGDSARGGFALGAFEGLGLALGRHWNQLRPLQNRIDAQELVKELWNTAEYRGSFSGMRARERMQRVTPAANRVVASAILKAKPPTRKRISTLKA